MKKYILMFLFFSVIIVAQTKKPRIFSPNPEHNFGDVFEGDVVEHE